MLFPKFLLDDLLHDGLTTGDSKTRVKKTDKGYKLLVSMPGVESKNVSVDLDPTKNLINIEILEASEFIGSGKRTFEIPQSVDLDSIETSFDLGVLEIELPRKSEAALRKLM